MTARRGSSSSSDVITADEEEYEQPIDESIVNTYIGGPLDAFSRPTQVLSGDEVRRLPPRSRHPTVHCATLCNSTWLQ